MYAYEIYTRFWKEVHIMWETAFGVVCLGLIVLNIGFCLFDNEG